MTKQVCEISWGIGLDLAGTIDDAIKQLQKYKTDGFTHLLWEENQYDDGYNLYIQKFRDETAEETAKRECYEKEIMLEMERQDRLRYEALKKKFGQQP